MPYFDLTEDGGLLHPSVRLDEDIEYYAERAEADLFAFYTQINKDLRNTPGIIIQSPTLGGENIAPAGGVPSVRLSYYKADPDELTTTAELKFKTDVKRAIAMLVEMRIRESGRAHGVKMERRGRRTTEYFENSSTALRGVPHEVRVVLSQYDIREPV